MIWTSGDGQAGWKPLSQPVAASGEVAGAYGNQGIPTTIIFSIDFENLKFNTMNLSQHAGRLILPLCAVDLDFLLHAIRKMLPQPGLSSEVGNHAVSFTHKFNPADYEEGKRIVVEEFSSIENSGQIRRTYFMSNPDSAGKSMRSHSSTPSSTSEWLNSEERDAVLQKLYPLYREPLLVENYTTG